MIFRRKNTVPQAASIPTGQTVPANPAVEVPQPNSDSNKKVLVVDDDPVSTKALSLKLASRGFSVVTASDGSQALRTSRREKPDVLLVDVNFPPDVAHGGGVPWNGFLITQWLQRLEPTKNTPVILISSNDREEYKKRASAVGAFGFLPKSIDNQTLVTSIETALIRKADVEPSRIPATRDQLNQTAAVSSGQINPPNATPALAAGAANTGNPTLELGL